MNQKIKVKKHQKNVSDEKLKDKNQFSIPFWLIVSFFIITTVIFFYGQLSGKYFFWEDFTEQVYPQQTFAAESFYHLEIPFWNPYTFCGMPFYSDLQVGFFYPLNRLSMLFFENDGKLSVWGLQFIIIIHFFISQLLFYLFLRYLKVSQLAAIFGSITYSFSFVMVLHVFHPMMVYHLAWFPLVLMYYFKSIDEKKIKFAFLAGLIFGTSMLAGHPQTILYQILFLGIYFIWILIKNIIDKLSSKDIFKLIINGILPLVIALMIFSIQYLPSQTLANLSKRADSNYEMAVEGSLQFKQIFTSIVPKLFGYVDANNAAEVPFHLKDAPYYYYWDTGFYFGIIALLLGLIGFFFKNKYKSFFIFIAIFGFLFALGDNFVLFKIFYYLPFFGLLRIPARIMFFVVIAFSVLSSFGIDYLLKNKFEFKNFKFSLPIYIVLGTTLLIILGIIPSLINTPDNYIQAIKNYGLTSLIFVILSIILVYLLSKIRKNYIVIVTSLILLTYIDLYFQGSNFNESQKNPAEAYKLNADLKELFVPKDINNLFRVSTRHYNPGYMATMRNQGLIDKIMLVEGYNQLVFNHIPPPCDVKTIHDLYNVKYELAYDNQSRQFSFVERSGFFPRAWFVYDAIVSTPNKIKEFMTNNKDINYKKTVVLENKPIKTYDSTANIGNSINFIKYSNNGIILEVQTDNDGILVLAKFGIRIGSVILTGKKLIF